MLLLNRAISTLRDRLLRKSYRPRKSRRKRRKVIVMNRRNKNLKRKMELGSRKMLESRGHISQEGRNKE